MPLQARVAQVLAVVRRVEWHIRSKREEAGPMDGTSAGGPLRWEGPAAADHPTFWRRFPKVSGVDQGRRAASIGCGDGGVAAEALVVGLRRWRSCQVLVGRTPAHDDDAVLFRRGRHESAILHEARGVFPWARGCWLDVGRYSFVDGGSRRAVVEEFAGARACGRRRKLTARVDDAGGMDGALRSKKPPWHLARPGSPLRSAADEIPWEQRTARSLPSSAAIVVRSSRRMVEHE